MNTVKRLWLLVAMMLLTAGTAAAALPEALPFLDYNCNGVVDVADIGTVVVRSGQNLNLAELWLYDLDRDGAVTEYDVKIAAALWNRADLPIPIWCENKQ